MKQTFLGLCLIAFLCISCSKVYLTFSRVDKPTSTNVTKIIIAVDKIDDNRITKKFDNIFIRPPINEMQNYLLRQLNNVSFVSRAIKIEDGQINDSIINSVQQIDLIIKLKCYDFKWNLPKRDEVFAGSFIAGLSGGILGGLSYGEKLTEVEGFSVFEVSIFDNKNNVVILNNKFSEKTSFQETINDCDSRESKSKAIGNAFSVIVQDIIYILEDRMNSN